MSNLHDIRITNPDEMRRNSTRIPTRITDRALTKIPTQRLDHRGKFMSHIPQEIVDDAEASLEHILNQDGLSAENVLYVTTRMMTIVGKYKTLSGRDKKEIVVILVNDAIEKYIDDERYQLLQQIISLRRENKRFARKFIH